MDFAKSLWIIFTQSTSLLCRVLGDKYKQWIPYQMAHTAWERNIMGLSARMKQYFIENVLTLNLQGS